MNKINFLTDTKMVISLKRRTDRRSNISSQFQKIGASNYLIMDAIDAQYLPFDPSVSHSSGAEACKMSHQAIIKHAKASSLPYIIILEDDALFCDNFNERLDIVMQQLPEDWDMFYFGGNNVTKAPLTMVSENIGKSNATLSTVAYVIRNTIYDSVLEALNTKNVLDLIYAEKVQSKHNCYCSSPSLIGQISDFSDVENVGVNYESVMNLWK